MNYLNLKISTIVIVSMFLLNKLNAQENKSFQLKNILNEYKAEKQQFNSVEFLVFKNSDIPKPTIIFISGSNFNPFFVNGKSSVFPFDINPYLNEFNFVAISKPGIPINSDSISNKYINECASKGYYLNDSGVVPKKYIDFNNISFYLKSYNTVIKSIMKKKWCNKNKIYLVAHSQGVKIASQIALENSIINKVVLLSPGSIYSRFHENIRKIRYDEMGGVFSPEKAQYLIDSITNRYQDLMNNKNDNSKLFDAGSTYYSYHSFVNSEVKDKILKIPQKTLLIYGTGAGAKDIDCDYLKLYLIENHKLNITVKPKVGYDHNYYYTEYNDQGEIIKRTYNWNNIFKETVEWLNNEK